MSAETELVVVALCGKARAGKDAVAQALASQAGFFRMGLADGLKSALNDLDGHTWEFRKERDAAGKSERWAAQQMGTECREAIGYPGHWVTHLMIKMHYAHKVHPVPRHRFVIPDLRYPQEAARLRAAVESLGGRLEIWRIDRPGQGEIAESGHSSERHADKIPVDLVIENTGTLEQLNESVKGALRVALIHKADMPPGCCRNEKGRICGIVEDEPSQPRDEWREFCDYMGWSPDAPFDPSNARKPLHDIPAIDDALNGCGPFPVLYLSGPMSGCRDLNFPAFNRAAAELRRRGFPVLNPADFGAHSATTWEDNLHRDLNVLGFADILVQLPGWECSRGASLEFSTAVALGKGVTSVDSLISLHCKSSNEDFSKNPRPDH